MFRDELFQGRQLFPKRGDLGFGVGLFGPFVGHDFLGSRRNESFVRDRLAETVRRSCPALRTAWYSGRERLPEGFDLTRFDYVKLGPWVEALGPLTAPTTNQRLYRIAPDGTMSDITARFRRNR